MPCYILGRFKGSWSRGKLASKRFDIPVLYCGIVEHFLRIQSCAPPFTCPYHFPKCFRNWFLRVGKLYQIEVQGRLSWKCINIFLKVNPIPPSSPSRSHYRSIRNRSLTSMTNGAVGLILSMLKLSSNLIFGILHEFSACTSTHTHMVG